MKRMVKNGDLIDVEPDGSITVAGKPIGGGGGGGGDYTAGSNIEISEAKEISVKPDITGINSIKLSPDYGVKISGTNNGAISFKSGSATSPYPDINIERYDSSTGKGNIRLQFLFDSTKNSFIVFNGQGSFGDLYPLLARGSRIPFVPNENGTYVLKATVSGEAVTYTWEPQA